MKKMLLYQGPLIACAGIIFVLSSLSQVSRIPLPHHLDKLAHAVVYAVLAITARRAFSHQAGSAWLKRHASILAVVFSLVYGVTDEFHQQFVPGRVSSLLDLVADVAGAAVAVAVLEWRMQKRASVTTSN
jgi:VanZ family protein